MTNNCNNVISLKQYGATCWFNSILMALLYSDESRKLLLKKSKKWNKKIEVLNTIKYILQNKYLRTDKVYKDYEYFDKIRPEYILKQLYNYNKKKFIIDPDINKNGYKSSLYIRKIYKLLGVNILYLDLDLKTKNIYYSINNNVEVNKKIVGNKITLYYKYKNYRTLLKYLKNPDIIIINPKDNINITRYPSWYKINNNISYKKFWDIINFANLTNKVINNNNIYIEDSVLLTNYNKNEIGGHSIAGITCKGNRYVYNGWSRSTIDPNMKSNGINYIKNIPCELMNFDWNINENKEFCLNKKKCILDIMNVKDLCFSFNKGTREIIYVKKQSDNKLNIKKDVKCDKNKVINPLTNRCINAKTINKLTKTNLSKPEKICPEGKIINPLTNRCIKVKTINKLTKTNLSRPEKICPEDKIINPKTGRCIKAKTIKKLTKTNLSKPKKICPEGKIINPLTNRCIKEKL